jgi:hypothetical protein
MKHRAVQAIIVLVLIVASTCLPATPAGIRSVGLRLILPWSGIPLSLGAEVVTDTEFGGLSLSLFLSPAGGTLLLGSADIALAGDANTANAFLRLTTGLSYFDPSRRLPSFLFGAGTSVSFTAMEPFAFGFAGELIYPLAFPMPMFTLSGAWSLP